MWAVFHTETSPCWRGNAGATFSLSLKHSMHEPNLNNKSLVLKSNKSGSFEIGKFQENFLFKTLKISDELSKTKI
jgi:hypothetical protein